MPDVHLDWEMTSDEFTELRTILLSHPESAYVQRLIADGALGAGIHVGDPATWPRMPIARKENTNA